MSAPDDTLFDSHAIQNIETLTVRQVNQKLEKTLKRGFPSEIWVRGEIRNLNRSASGHVYFSMVEPQTADTGGSAAVQRLRTRANATPSHMISVVMFNSTRQMVNRILTRSGAGRMEDGIEIRIRAAIEYHAPRGSLQLRMTSIDPEYTLGRLAADRSAILSRLSAEDLIDANCELAFPAVPLRVALITSAGSAAAADFTDELARSGFRFDVRAFDSRVQGQTAAEYLVRSIAAAQESDADVVALIRGGGSQVDLATFDNEELARAIAACSIPVVVGIGHETDRSIADEVAHTSRKTPTACANHLVECVRSFDDELVKMSRLIAAAATSKPYLHEQQVNALADRAVRTSRSALDQAMLRTSSSAHSVQRRTEQQLTIAATRLDRSRTRVQPRVESILRRAEQALTTHQAQLVSAAPRALRSQERDLDNWQAQVRALDPVRTLQRGFSITTDQDGQLVRSTQDSPTHLITRVADGEIHSTVAENPAST